jgi:hypothetical protein
MHPGFGPSNYKLDQLAKGGMNAISSMGVV